MRPAEVVRRATVYLDRHDVESPRSAAETLLANVLHVDRSSLYTRAEGLSSAEARRFGRALCRRCTGTPVQHLTGEEGFRRLVLRVRPGVFVPRPETEVVVDVALDAISAIRAPKVADVGTGTGAIALAIKDEHPDAVVFATDLSAEAVELARENAAVTELDIDIRQGDLLDPLPPGDGDTLDLVVANPPYISAGEYRDLPDHVRADPASALIGDLATYEHLFASAVRGLRAGGWLVVEIGSSQGAAVSTLAARSFDDVRVVQDLAGRDRVVVARARA